MKAGISPQANWTQAQKKEMQQILDDEKEVEDTRKILTDKINTLMERGEKLDDLEEHATALKDEANIFKENTVSLKKAEQTAQSREYSLFMSWLGIGIGFVGGLMAGVAWPIALLYGGVTGLAFFGLTRTFTSINQAIDNAAQKISPYLPPSPFSNSEKSTKNPILVKYTALKAKVNDILPKKPNEKSSTKSNNPRP